jgi:hypothetical protein
MKITAAYFLLIPLTGCTLPMAVSEPSAVHQTLNQTLAPPQNTEPHDRDSTKQKPGSVVLQSPSEQPPEQSIQQPPSTTIDQVKAAIERRLYIIDDKAAAEMK